jgi:hypothetical protein
MVTMQQNYQVALRLWTRIYPAPVWIWVAGGRSGKTLHHAPLLIAVPFDIKSGGLRQTAAG